MKLKPEPFEMIKSGQKTIMDFARWNSDEFYRCVTVIVASVVYKKQADH